MKHPAFAGALVCVLAVISAPALASNAVTIPWGDWLADVLNYFNQIVIGVVVAVFGWLVRKLPAQIADFIFAMKVEQLLTRSLGYAVGAVAGAARGKAVTVDIANDVLREAAKYAAANAPTIAGRIADTLRPKLLARLHDFVDLPPDLTADKVGAGIKK